MKNRREFVRDAAAVSAAVLGGARWACGRDAGGVEGAGSLKAHAGAHGLLYGCAVDTRALQEDAEYRALIVQQCSLVVAENAMKWGALRPGPDAFDFAEADALVAFAEKNGIRVRGHNLCWHESIPKWFVGYATPANAQQLLTEHIAKVAGRYAGRMESWDVVNEAVDPKDGRPDGLRDSPWLKLLGPGYIDTAFRAARAADGKALLTYNDYGIEGEDGGSAAKRATVLRLLRGMKERGVPLDALGVQSHITAGHTYGNGLREMLRTVEGMGLKVFVTELDVNDKELPSDVAARDKAVAATYRQYLDLVLANRAVEAVLTWGITDRRTWLNYRDTRTDKLQERCLPFDGEYQPVAAFYAMRQAFDARRAG